MSLRLQMSPVGDVNITRAVVTELEVDSPPGVRPWGGNQTQMSALFPLQTPATLGGQGDVATPSFLAKAPDLQPLAGGNKHASCTLGTRTARGLGGTTCADQQHHPFHGILVNNMSGGHQRLP